MVEAWNLQLRYLCNGMKALMNKIPIQIQSELHKRYPDLVDLLMANYCMHPETLQLSRSRTDLVIILIQHSRTQCMIPQRQRHDRIRITLFSQNTTLCQR